MVRSMLVLVMLVSIVFFGCQTSPDTMEEKDEMHSEESMDSMDSDTMEKSEYMVTIEVLPSSVTPIAPVVWAVHTGTNPFLDGDMDGRIPGLEALAEDGNPEMLNESVAMLSEVHSHGVVAVPDGAMDAGPAFPGHGYSFSVSLGADEKLSFATMFVQSNDLFFSPGPEGLSVSMDMDMNDGDVTNKIMLYDAGTEMNEMPGEGPNQPPRQSGPDTGMDEMGTVMAVMDVDDGFMYPETESVLRVTVKAGM